MGTAALYLARRGPSPDRTAAAPARPAGKAITFLLIGSDIRSETQTTGTLGAARPGSQRSDAILLVQLAARRDEAVVVSIPRDSWIPIPGHGMAKINAAYAHGGAPLLVRTIEQLTGVTIDHYAIIDFVAFKRLTDQFGGVDVSVADRTAAFGVAFQPGSNALQGEQALAYVRQRKGLPGGDLDRVKRHQSYLRALSARARRDLVHDPARLVSYIRAVTDTVTLDPTLTPPKILLLATESPNLSPDRVRFLTAPVAGFGWQGKASVVYLDAPKAALMWRDMRTFSLAKDAASFSPLPSTPR